MNDAIKAKLSKVYELVNNGATEGEKAAAKKALDRLMDRYNITEASLSDLSLHNYTFKYKTALDEWLWARLVRSFLPHAWENVCKRPWGKTLVATLTYEDWITLESCYEYFRRHMAVQWRQTAAAEVARCRKAKTKNKRRSQLQELFFTQYCIASNLYKPHELTTCTTDKMSPQEYKDRRMLNRVEGGQYNKQVVGGLFLANE